MYNQLEVIKSKIEEAEYVLVGCGLGMENVTDFAEEEIYKPLAEWNISGKAELKEELRDDEAVEWIHQMLVNSFNKHNTLPVYSKLGELLKDKNYFILSMNTSELIMQSGLDKSKMVMPCGNEGLFQCSKSCTHEIQPNNDYVENFMERLPQIMKEVKAGGNMKDYLPYCNECKEPLTCNVRANVETYVEEGYLPQWQNYMQWLSRTLNRKLLLIELEADFTLPSLIRWPFEKNAFLNNKAFLIRVNHEFPQLSEEIKGKGMAVAMTANEFLKLVN
ncbi:hypothetical protein [Anaerosporobacter sp.]|uniref:hypothetical protein n=1 Tax=Anaerosporobacter sp. TaxID=1872529 RepID=UPI00286F093D|nr:hypothetical protein [Anaerosporobacter sp.]